MVRKPLVALVLSIAGVSVAAEPISGIERLDFREVIQEARERVFPAVVFVKVIRESHESGRRESQPVSGSGVLISPTGEVLTNWHVVDKAIEVRCQLQDGRGYTADVVGSDKDLDLALIRLRMSEGGESLPYAEIGASGRLREGDFVMAMGAPWGMTRSVSIGIVSCTRRFLPEASEYSLWLQTDAAISPGNSGGPLIDTEGRIVGINTRGVMYGGDMGFAVPSDVIVDLLPRLRAHGSAEWSWSGLHLQPLRDFDRNIYFEGEKGMIVSGVEPGSPAQTAGILPRDRIHRIAGRDTNALSDEDLPDIRRSIGMLEPERGVEVVLVREGKEMSVTLTPTAKGQVEGEELDFPRWDFSVKEINQFDNPGLYFFRNEGVFIYGLKTPGNAMDAGLRAQDIIVKVDDVAVTRLEEMKAIHRGAIEQVATKSRVLVTVLRNGLTRQFVLNFGRDYEKK